jgi:hypothetical protein
MPIIDTTVFTGRFKVPTPYNGSTKLQEYIDHYELKYLNELLGAELFVLFEEGVTAEEEIYEKILNPFAFDSDIEEKPVVSFGMAHMLKCLIYAHYWNEDLSLPTANGKVKIQPEAGELQNDNYSNSIAFYNEGIQTYKAIQLYIEENKTDYPTFKGVQRGLTWFF